MIKCYLNDSPLVQGWSRAHHVCFRSASTEFWLPLHIVLLQDQRKSYEGIFFPGHSAKWRLHHHHRTVPVFLGSLRLSASQLCLRIDTKTFLPNMLIHQKTKIYIKFLKSPPGTQPLHLVFTPCPCLGKFTNCSPCFFSAPPEPCFLFQWSLPPPEIVSLFWQCLKIYIQLPTTPSTKVRASKERKWGSKLIISFMCLTNYPRWG